MRPTPITWRSNCTAWRGRWGGAVNVLASAFVELECRLTGMAVTPALAPAVRQIYTRLQDLLDSLE
jgi:hypothetical protein